MTLEADPGGGPRIRQSSTSKESMRVKARRRILATPGRCTHKERCPRIERQGALSRTASAITCRAPRHARADAGDLGSLRFLLEELYCEPALSS
jgi:hypothetical protein